MDPHRCGRSCSSMKIPDHVLAAAREDLGSPEVEGYLASLRERHGLPKDLPREMLYGPPLLAWRALRQAHQHAQEGTPWKNPYLDPEQTLLGSMLSASERMRVRSAEPWDRMRVAHDILSDKP